MFPLVFRALFGIRLNNSIFDKPCVGPATKELKDIDYIAIGVGIGITLSMFIAILFYMIRGNKRLKEGNLKRTDRFTANGQVSHPPIEFKSINLNSTCLGMIMFSPALLSFLSPWYSSFFCHVFCLNEFLLISVLLDNIHFTWQCSYKLPTQSLLGDAFRGKK